MSLITFFQSIGSAIDFDRFPVTAKIKKWAGVLKNFITLIANGAIGYLNSHDFRLIMALIILVLSAVTFIPSFMSGLKHRYLPLRLMIYIPAIAPLLAIFYLELKIYVQLLIFIFSPLFFFVIRFFACKCWRNVFDDIKYAPTEEDLHKQKTLIINNFNPDEYLKTVRESIQIREPKLYLDLLKIIAAIGLFVASYFSRKTIFVVIPCALFGVILFIPGVLGLCECSRKFKYKIKAILKRLTFTVFTLFLDIFYIPLLTYFIQILYSTNVQCPPGYYWGSFRAIDTLLKTQGHCIPCADTLRLKYPGYEGYMNTHSTRIGNVDEKMLREDFQQYLANNSGIYKDSFNTINSTFQEGYAPSYELCPHLCSGSPIRVVKTEPSIYFDYDILPIYTIFLFWAVAFIMIGCPVLYFVLIYRARKEFKTIPAYGDSKEYRWYCLMRRVDTVGAKYCKDLTYFNPYWGIVKILYKFLVLLITTLANLAHKNIIGCLPAIHILMFILTFVRKPYFSFLNNLVDMILYATNAVVGIIATINVFKPIPAKVNSAFVIIADVVGVIATAAAIVANMLDKKKLEDPTRLTDNDLIRIKREEEKKADEEKERKQREKEEAKQAEEKDKKGEDKKNRKNSKRKHPNSKRKHHNSKRGKDNDLLDNTSDSSDVEDESYSKNQKKHKDDMSDFSDSDDERSHKSKKKEESESEGTKSKKKEESESEALKSKKKEEIIEEDNVDEDEILDIENVKEDSDHESKDNKEDEGKEKNKNDNESKDEEEENLYLNIQNFKGNIRFLWSTTSQISTLLERIFSFLTTLEVL
ncbi:hypothetical protein TVAG_305970 [Trichomonas vaginalis G3]|uniref:TRP C-terminal domain-containing protein n=1 Tax=Trichomonas vaginalis (strain ATCC PRA-98 / G3) TaxID=412133 RepID=A2DN89_TRIV3|nr:hypothetical protein TVAGG3_1024080 [Trichomonas vaginalis G3]EAY18077.1 hypothetical protein TVAG_305970 [Trichomonas vaginalis G3]KAI5492352.1 hypothetical protein TVAGG3_1024080 [Trichomonas vaginalis G3]|eukprot:XP_001579063.1 hypothetical protein [Trichomonas vaginalis G3]